MPYSSKTKNANLLVIACAILMLASVGCKTSTWFSKNLTGNTVGPGTNGNELADQLTSVVPANATAAPAANRAAGNQPTSPQQAATPQQIMADVRELGAVNPAAQTALMQELEKADPDIWPDVVQNFRSRLAYGDRLHNEEMLAANQTFQKPGPQYANGNPYYANQPIPTNTASQPTPLPAYPPQAQASHHMYPQQSYATEPSNTPPNQAPQNYAPQNYAAPLPLPNSPNPSSPIQTKPAYQRTSAKPTTSKVIQASYEESFDAPFIDSDNQQPEDEAKSALTAAPQTSVELDWQESLAASIESLQKKLDTTDKERANSAGIKTDQLRLRFMLLAAGRSTEATEPISDESEAMTDFWAGQMFGLGTLLDERKASNPTQRNALAKHKLSEALQHLGKASDLAVRRLSFCKEVNSFANIKQFKKYEFRPGEQVILYAELDNLKHEETIDGYQTSLKIGYKIFDSAERLIDEQQSNSSQECSPVLRRDYYVSQLIRLPERLYPGRHILKLTVEDKQGQKYGESTIEFNVK